VGFASYAEPMFGRRSTSQNTTADSALNPGSPGQGERADDPSTDSQKPKGRATPSRKEAEQTRKKALKVPADPKAAKKAMKARERESRAEARAGLMAGEEKFLPPRDQGPAKAFTRDFIDKRRRLAEFFVFVAVGILVAGFVGGQAQGIISLLWFIVTGAVVLEVVWILVRRNRALQAQWPEKPDRKGCLPYATLRQLQVRKLRIPPPRIRPGGAPVQPKGN
jgi:hypothetical protein